MRSGRSALFFVLIGTLLPAGATLGGGFDRAVESATARVVKLYGLGAGRQEGYGTGVIVSRDGLVLTVHSLLIDARAILAVAADGTRYQAAVVTRDSPRQLALLRLKHPGDSDGDATGLNEPNDPGEIGPLDFFDLNEQVPLMPGDWVIAAGNAFKIADGSEPVSIAHGVFSIRTRLDARRRVKDFPYRGDVLVIDAITSNPGAPGSALVNLDGRFVGMIGRVVMSNLTHTQFNYAVPRDVLFDFLTEATESVRRDAAVAHLPDHDQSETLDLGIRLSRTGYRKVLPYVARVRRNSLAQRAGVRKDDLILSFNGTTVGDADDYDECAQALVRGQAVDLVIRRGRRIITIKVDPELPK